MECKMMWKYVKIFFRELEHYSREKLPPSANLQGSGGYLERKTNEQHCGESEIAWSKQ